uniref:Uncharacterized protein n=1 Tax=Anopheles atroparvus TaxID=41427 RepID=A0AAG5D3U2_ANOAO
MKKGGVKKTLCEVIVQCYASRTVSTAIKTHTWVIRVLVRPML